MIQTLSFRISYCEVSGRREKQHKKYPLPSDDKNTIKTFDTASDEEEEFYVGEFLESDDDLT